MKFSKTLLLLSLALTGCESRGTHMPGLPTPPPPYPKAVATPIDPALQTAARAEIENDLHSSDEIIRAHALETIKDLRLTDADPEVIAALEDRSRLVRKAAAMVIGELQIKAAADRLPNLLQTDTSASGTTTGDAVGAQQERMAAIFALHRLGNTQYSHELEKTAFYVQPRIRAETAFILGLIGDKSAIPILITMLQKDKDPNVKLQVGEALWRMGDERGEDALLAGTVSSYASDQMLAVYALAEPRNTIVLGHVEGLFSSDYLEVRLVTARAAGMLGEDEGYGVAMQGAASVDPRQRALAAMAFGAIGRSDAQPRLAELLKDTDPDVRLAAANALLAIGQKT
jgi:HEAT repeat protein